MVRVWGGWVGTGQDVALDFDTTVKAKQVKSEEEAIELANVTEFGLGAALFTKDIEKAEALARRLDAGFIYVNDFVQSQSDVPSGGVKNSGFGKECHREGHLDLSMAKSIIIQHQP